MYRIPSDKSISRCVIDKDIVEENLKATVQACLEKQLSAAIARYDVQNGAFGLVMNCKTGEILAMATLGSYCLLYTSCGVISRLPRCFASRAAPRRSSRDSPVSP